MKVLTVPRTAVYLHPHADRSGVLAVGDESNFTRDEGKLQVLAHNQVGVCVASQYLKHTNRQIYEY